MHYALRTILMHLPSDEPQPALDHQSEHVSDARPPYPAAIAGAILRRAEGAGPLRMLEVGCGAGKATRLFAGSAHQIHAIDPSIELVALAGQRLGQRPNLRFEIGRFEALALPERSYDLVFAGQSFHWIEPASGLARAQRLLRPGGVLALFWNFLNYDATPMLRRMRAACIQHVPAFAGWPDASNARFIAFANLWRTAIGNTPGFEQVIEMLTPSVCTYDHATFLQLTSAFSWFRRLPEPQRAALLAELRDLLALAEPPLTVPVRTLLLTATCVEAG